MVEKHFFLCSIQAKFRRVEISIKLVHKFTVNKIFFVSEILHRRFDLVRIQNLKLGSVVKSILLLTIGNQA